MIMITIIIKIIQSKKLLAIVAEDSVTFLNYRNT